MSFLLRFNKFRLRQTNLFPGARILINTSTKLRTVVNKAECLKQPNTVLPAQISSFITSSKLTIKRHFVATSIHQVDRKKNLHVTSSALKQTERAKDVSLIKQLQITNPKSVSATNDKMKTNLLHNWLGLPSQQRYRARYLRKKYPQWNDLSLNHCKAVSDTLYCLNFTEKDTDYGIALFGLSPVKLHHQYAFLQECCLKEINPYHMHQFLKLLQLTFPMLKHYCKLDTEDVVGYWITQLPCQLHKEISSLVREDQRLNHDSSVAHIRNLICSNFLSWKLHCSFEEARIAIDTSLGKKSPQTVKSFVKAVDILINIGFDKKMILENPIVLNTQGDELEMLLTNFPQMLGEKIESVLLSHPVMCTFYFNHVKQNVPLLTDFGYPLQTLVRKIDMLEMNPWDLREKFAILKKYPELKVICHHLEFHKLLHDIDAMQVRLEALRSVDRRRVSYQTLHHATDSKKLLKIMQEPMLSKIPLEIVLYLSNVLGEPPKKIEVVLKSHPHWNQINAANVKDVIDMLTRCNFTPKQIFGGIQLVIYPSNEVAIALRKLNEETKSDPHLLNAALSNGLEYIIYLIEKESNFSGNSVFMHEKNEAKTQDKPEKDSPDC